MKILHNLIFSLLALSLFVACEPDTAQNIDSPNWELVWSDEFNAPDSTAIDAGNWNYDIGTGQNGWGNQEQQTYTNRPENITILDSQLVITALDDGFSGASFSSARITTKGKFEQAYGRFEASIQTPYGPGLWPAFWMLGSNIDDVSWPQCGEIDIMELRGQEPNIMAGSIHGPGYSAGNAITKDYALQNDRFDTDFYLYAVEWHENRLDFFVDDFMYHRITRKDVEDAGGEWVFDQPFYLLLNVAVGGTYVGPPTPETPFPQTMKVDYIRVYQAN